MSDEYKEEKLGKLRGYYEDLGYVWGPPEDNEDYRTYYLVAGLLVLSESIDALYSIIDEKR